MRFINFNFLGAVLLILAAGLPARAQDGVTDLLIDPAVGATIQQSGSYRLVADVTMTGTSANAIYIGARDVTLDLGGHTITAAQNSVDGSGITGQSGFEGMRVFNGKITGFQGNGVNLGTRAVLRDVYVEACNKYGGLSSIRVEDGSVVENCVVANCHPSSGSVTAIQIGSGSRVQGCIVEQNKSNTGSVTGISASAGCTIVDNIVRGNVSGTSGGGTGIAVFGSSGIVRGNNVYNNTLTGTGNLVGILVGDGAVVERNAITNLSVASTAAGDVIGIDAASNNLIEGNECNGLAGGSGSGSDVTGIRMLNQNHVIGNACSNNSTTGGNVVRGILVSGNSNHVQENSCSANKAAGTAGKTRGIEIGGVYNRVDGNTCSNNDGTGGTIAEAIGIVLTANGDSSILLRNVTFSHSTATLYGGIHIETNCGYCRIQENITTEAGFDIQNDGTGTSIPAAGNHLENVAY